MARDKKHPPRRAPKRVRGAELPAFIKRPRIEGRLKLSARSKGAHAPIGRSKQPAAPTEVEEAAKPVIAPVAAQPISEPAAAFMGLRSSPLPEAKLDVEKQLEEAWAPLQQRIDRLMVALAARQARQDDSLLGEAFEFRAALHRAIAKGTQTNGDAR